MKTQMIFAGSGGQGLMTIGKLYAGLAVEPCAHVTYFPSYGTEVRGGTANCQVILSDGEISSPIVIVPNILLIMNQESFDKFAPRLAEGGKIILNTSLANSNGNKNVIEVPATQIADELGDVRAANFVMLGALAKHLDVLSIEILEKSILKAMKGRTELVELNTKAIHRGYAI